MTPNEKEENDKLDKMENNFCVEREIFISKDQQVVYAMDGNEHVSVESKLTKEDVISPPAAKSNDNISALTGKTRESKAKSYAVEDSKKVASQYVDTISTLTSRLEGSSNTVANLEARLGYILRQLRGNSDTAEDTKDRSTNLDVAM